MTFRQFFKQKQPVTPLPYVYYVIPVVVIALVGLFDSLYLAISHYRNYVDIGYQSFCAISQAFNCDTVSQSPYSIMLGVPLAVWGILGYGLFLFLLGFVWHASAEKKRMWTLLMALALGFSLYSVYLAYISAYRINSHCIMCILSYAVSLALLFYTWIIRNRFGAETIIKAIKKDILFLFSFPKTSFSITTVFAGAAIVMMLAFPSYWHMNPPELSYDVPTGTTQTGHPWIGAEEPELTIIEFSDYRCFQCKKMHYFLRHLVETNPSKIRLVHRHFPMDHIINPIVREPFHQGSARLSILALLAVGKKKFWEMNDLLYALPRGNLTISFQDVAEQTGIDIDEIRYALQDVRLWETLQKDIFDGLKYELTGTPGFVINDVMYTAQIPPEILKPYMN